MDDLFEDLPDEVLFTAEEELKKKIVKLERELKKHAEAHEKELKVKAKMEARSLLNVASFYEDELQSLREQVGQLFEKNLELHETSKIFVRGLEHLRKDGITITLVEEWSRKGVYGSLKTRIAQLVLDGKHIVSICPMETTHQGETIKAIIVTEHTDKTKKPI